ncbi:hypothetical protein C8Q80DRAFT_468676 [Daedaleopsis nitida]|nr:hypothetical protein C8Q80DRAFT_468676 [Daedaleopsis nitida]
MNTAEHLLSGLKGSNPTSVSCATHVTDFVNSVGGQMWSMNHLRQGISADLGEYGYIQRDADGERFVCLGHIDELPDMPPTSTFALHRKEAPNGSTPWSKVHHWPGEIFSADFKLDTRINYTETSVLIHDISRENSRSFFWDHAEDIALRHGIRLHELNLVVEIRRTAQVSVSESKRLHSDGPSSSRSVYFHYLPLIRSPGECSKAWGYWSLESIPAASPLNDRPVIEGVSLAHKKTACYYYLSPLQAEVVRTLNSLRRPDFAKSEDEGRFETIS